MKRLLKKLRGYQKAPRDRFELLINKVLNQEEFILYEFGIAITDWDIEHVETYGTFEATNKEIAMALGWKSDSTVSRHKKSLIKKGLFYIENSGLISPKDFDKWQLRKFLPAKIHESPAHAQTQPANIQDSSSKMQENRGQEEVYSLSFFKGNSSLLRKEEEYQKIYKEGGYTLLTPDDMRWIDENI